MTNALNTLGEKIADTIDSLIEDHGFTFPIYSVSISSNGCLLAAYFDGPAQPPRMVAEYLPDSRGFALPINWVFVNNGDGRAAKLTIETSGMQHLRWEN
jgi:hypothetical protein